MDIARSFGRLWTAYRDDLSSRSPQCGVPPSAIKAHQAVGFVSEIYNSVVWVDYFSVKELEVKHLFYPSASLLGLSQPRLATIAQASRLF